MIGVGVVCYLVGTGNAEVDGRVVTVTGHSGEHGEWNHTIDAEWVRHRFPRASLVLARRRNLVPISAPDLDLHEERGELERMIR